MRTIIVMLLMIVSLEGTATDRPCGPQLIIGLKVVDIFGSQVMVLVRV
jgi:hypothetical protein